MSVHIDKLLKMAEQITANLAYTDDEALVAARVADHLNRFWDPRMKESLLAHAVQYPDAVSPALCAALSQLS